MIVNNFFIAALASGKRGTLGGCANRSAANVVARFLRCVRVCASSGLSSVLSF
jgi:hypothetical protein